MFLSIISGCNKNIEQNKQTSDTAQNNTQPTPKQSGQKAIIPNINSESGGWIKIRRGDRELFRCFEQTGCMAGDRKVLIGVTQSENELRCGNQTTSGIDFVQGYRCSEFLGKAVCMAGKCECGSDGMIDRDHYCVGPVIDGKFTAQGHVWYPKLEEDEEDEVETEDTETADQASAPNMRSCGTDEVIVDDGTYAEFECLEPQSTGSNATRAGYWYCTKPQGCRTPDGRIHFPMSIIQSDFGHLTVSDDYPFCMYYLEGETDTSTETQCKTGDCVIAPNADANRILVTIKSFGNPPNGFTRLRPECPFDAEDFHDEDAENGEEDECDDPEDAQEYGVDVEGYIIDTKSCEGGTKYCHGTKNVPIKAPEQPAGYECRSTRFVPGYAPDLSPVTTPDLKSWQCKTPGGCLCGAITCPEHAFCTNEQCYCGNEHIQETSSWNCEGTTVVESKALKVQRICRGESCQCAETACQMNEECVAGKCVCSDREKPNAQSWHCEQKTYFPHFEGEWRCGEADGCQCGESRCPLNGICRDGICTCDLSYEDVMPDEHYACSPQPLAFSKAVNYVWKCAGPNPCPCYGKGTVKPGEICQKPICAGAELTADGCMCGKERTQAGYKCMMSNQLGKVNVCVNEDCACGTKSCQYGEYCIAGQCHVPEIDTGIASHRYWEVKLMESKEQTERCEEESGCLCGAAKCPYHYYCAENQCVSGTHYITLRDHTYGFNIPDEYGYLDYEIADNLLFGSWRGCTQSSGAPKIDYAHSDHIEDYVCEFETDDCDDDSDEPCVLEDMLRPAGLTCNRSDYCMCGSTRCEADDRCDCTIDTGVMKCSCSNPDAIRELPGKMLGCGDSIIPESQSRSYQCVGDLGFMCDETDGCACGSSRCEETAFCLSANQCTRPIR